MCVSRFFQLGTELNISALGLDRDLGFSRGHHGHHGHQPPDDDDGEEEVDNEVEDNKRVTTTTRKTTMTKVSQLWD